jgi:signal transduction histidine kinase
VEVNTSVDKLFKRKRLWLTLTYASIMGCTLGLVGYTFERIVTSLSYRAVQKEISSLANTIHDSVEYKLATPGKIPENLYNKISDLCPIYFDCRTQPTYKNLHQHRLAVLDVNKYYASFVDVQSKPIAMIGIYPDLSTIQVQSLQNLRWDYLRDRSDTYYQQLTLEIHTPQNKLWGYLLVGRNLSEVEEYLGTVRLFLVVGIMVIGLLVTIISWYLAGLAMRPLSQSYQQMQQFTADAAHELRTPLATLQVTLENARAEYQHLGPDLNSWLDRIERQNIRISNLVNDLLFLSRLDLLPTERSLEPCCLTEIVLDLVEEFTTNATTKSIDIISNVDLYPQIWIDGNSEQLYRMGANLIDNAIKYTPTGGRVTISLSKTLNEISFQVQDTGIGIPERDRERIFDRFYRSELKPLQPQHSTGLGLAIVKSIVEFHGGKLKVSSQIAKGSIFTIELINRSLIVN